MASKKAAKAATTQAPVKVDHYTRRSDADVLQGAFCRIESGEHQSQIGVFESVVSTDGDGYPESVLVRLRNSSQLVTADYADLTPVEFGGR